MKNFGIGIDPGRWRPVVFAWQCDKNGNCPRCSTDYGECSCPGPMQEDEYEYKQGPNGNLLARRKTS